MEETADAENCSAAELLHCWLAANCAPPCRFIFRSAFCILRSALSFSALTPPHAPDILHRRKVLRPSRGEVPERPIGHGWKPCVPARVPRVRIPASPPCLKGMPQVPEPPGLAAFSRSLTGCPSQIFRPPYSTSTYVSYLPRSAPRPGKRLRPSVEALKPSLRLVFAPESISRLPEITVADTCHSLRRPRMEFLGHTGLQRSPDSRVDLAKVVVVTNVLLYVELSAGLLDELSHHLLAQPLGRGHRAWSREEDTGEGLVDGPEQLNAC